MSADPFGTDDLRRAVLQAWRSSPTRFREDANAEEDLVLGGYRDRWLVELAQNAADAAARAGVAGRLRVTVVAGAGAAAGAELRVANTGEPLDAAGVAALASLRASAKREPGSVGRFGIGFVAVLPVSTQPRVLSLAGGVRFSAALTRQLVAAEPGLRSELARRGGRVPVLRLVWPAEPGELPPAGFDTEVRLPLEPGADPAALLDAAAAQAADLLLALPALASIDVDGRCYRRRQAVAPAPSAAPPPRTDGRVVVLEEPAGSTTWLLVRRAGELPDGLLTAAEERHRPHWSVCWAVPVDADGGPRVLGDDVLHAPTPTDERLSLPARLLASLPLEPSRRRVRPGAAADFVLAEAVRAYPELVVALPAEHRTALVPAVGFPRCEVDAVLRDGVVSALRTASWLPPAGAGAGVGVGVAGGRRGQGDVAGGDPAAAPADGAGSAAGTGELSPATACVLDSPSPALAGLLAGAVPGLADARLSEPARAPALVVLGVPRLRPAEVVAAVSGLSRPPGWWHQLYEALTPLLDADPAAREDLAALPVPLADGRTVTGARGSFLVTGEVGPALGEAARLRIVHPQAAHPLLLRLGARPAGPPALLDSPELRAAVERSMDDAEAGLDTAALAGEVLRLVAAAGPAGAPGWLGALALPDEHGEPRRADELVLPDGALRAVLAADGPLGVLHAEVAAGHPREVLRAAGVLDGFAVVADEHPAGPDHDLHGEKRWWASLAEPPSRLVAIRDLELVDGGAWPVALRLLAADRDTGRALREPYARWWLARHARLAGHPPRHWRLPSADRLAGLYDPVPAAVLTAVSGGGGAGPDPLGTLAAAGVRAELAVTDVADAADLIARLADPRRLPSPATVRAAHAALTAACAAGVFDIDDVDPPDAVRATSGATAAAGRGYVLDLPWLAAIADPDRAVAGGEPGLLADLLDLPLASDELAAEVVSAGREVAWERLPEVAAACEALGREVPAGTLMLHDPLLVRDPAGEQHAVPFWLDGGVLHAADPIRALLWLP